MKLAIARIVRQDHRRTEQRSGDSYPAFVKTGYVHPMGLWLWVLVVAGVLLYFAVWGVIASYVAGLRGEDKLDAFKTGLFGGPVAALFILFKKESVPDVRVTCPHCGTAQDVDGNLKWYECWQCEERTDVSHP